MSSITPADTLSDLDARQDEVLSQLDDLNRRIETTLREFVVPNANSPAEGAQGS